MGQAWQRGKMLAALEAKYKYSPPLKSLEGAMFSEFTKCAAEASVSPKQVADDFWDIHRNYLLVRDDDGQLVSAELPPEFLVERFRKVVTEMRSYSPSSNSLADPRKLKYGYLLLKLRHLADHAYSDMHTKTHNPEVGCEAGTEVRTANVQPPLGQANYWMVLFTNLVSMFVAPLLVIAGYSGVSWWHIVWISLVTLLLMQWMLEVNSLRTAATTPLRWVFGYLGQLTMVAALFGIGWGMERWLT